MRHSNLANSTTEPLDRINKGPGSFIERPHTNNMSGSSALHKCYISGSNISETIQAQVPLTFFKINKTSWKYFDDTLSKRSLIFLQRILI